MKDTDKAILYRFRMEAARIWHWKCTVTLKITQHKGNIKSLTSEPDTCISEHISPSTIVDRETVFPSF